MKKKLELVRCDVEKRLREHGFFVKHVKRNEKNHNYSSSSSQQLNGRINAFVMRINLSNGRGTFPSLCVFEMLEGPPEVKISRAGTVVSPRLLY